MNCFVQCPVLHSPRPGPSDDRNEKDRIGIIQVGTVVHRRADGAGLRNEQRWNGFATGYPTWGRQSFTCKNEQNCDAIRCQSNYLFLNSLPGCDYGSSLSLFCVERERAVKRSAQKVVQRSCWEIFWGKLLLTDLSFGAYSHSFWVSPFPIVPTSPSNYNRST